MKTYRIKGPETTDLYFYNAESLTDIRHWIINHLDLSKKWNVSEWTEKDKAFSLRGDYEEKDLY